MGRTTRRWGVVWRWGLGFVVGLSGACAMTPMTTQCSRGQQWHDGQCVPTSSLVFERCLESFRKTRVERAHGVDTEVSAQVKGQGAALHRERKDHEAEEYDGLPPALMADAIGECRRQEEHQRTLELEQAWAAADEFERRATAARSEAESAARAQRHAEAQSERQGEAQRALLEELETAKEALRQVEEEREQEHARLVEEHPCTAGAWDRCGEHALLAKQAEEYGRAHRLYAQACEGGSVAACGNWGVMFEDGLGVQADPAHAARLYGRACDADDAHACVNLGYLYENGRGLPHDKARAVRLYTTACDAGQMRACGRLGLLVKGERALDLFERACGGGYARGCLWAGQRAIEDAGLDAGAMVAAPQFERACDSDVPEACVELGQLVELGQGVSADATRAAALYLRACDGGDARGCAAAQRLSRGGRGGERNTELVSLQRAP